MHGPVSRAVGGLLVLACLAGCGGPIQRDELKRGVKTLASDAADGALLARGVAQDRTRSPFVRVHGSELADDADHEAEKLHDAESNPPLTAKKQKAIVIAQRLSDALGRLQIAPGDERVGRTTELQLNGLARAANDLADSL